MLEIYFTGSSQIVLRPSSVQEISAVLRYCHSENLAVCPQGGNTGLVGGSIPIFDEIILSTCRLNKIIEIDDVSGSVSTLFIYFLIRQPLVYKFCLYYKDIYK